MVSMPSWELFDQQPPEYRDEVLPPSVRARVSVEQASTFGWERFVGTERSDDRDAHLRRLRAPEGPAEEVRLHARRDRRHLPAAARAAPRRGGIDDDDARAATDEPAARAARSRPERLVRLHPPRPDHLGRARAADRRGRPARHHLEPVDLGEGDRRLDRLRRRDRGAAARGRGATRRRSTSGSRSRTSATPPTRSGRCTSETERRDGFVSIEVVARPRPRHGGDDRRGGAAVGGDRTRERDGQGAGDAGGHPRDPGADRRAAST